MAGWQQVFWDNKAVSVIEANSEQPAIQSHEFELKQVSHAGTDAERTVSIHVKVEVDLCWQPFHLKYRIFVNDQLQDEGGRTQKQLEQSAPKHKVAAKAKISIIGLASLGFKLLKSAKMIKVVLAGASLAAYSWLFSLPFALTLIGCLIVHEYGHIKAMRYFGMKTKGMYLIPFMGGMAVSDDKINTRWQNVVISIMGPTFGLFMSLLALILYGLTDHIFFAGIAAMNALLNLFNMLPILPLDGGHILKSISFSMNSKLGLAVCAIAAALGIFISYSLGLALFGFLLLIGSIEIFLEWKTRHHNDLIPLDRYGQIFSTIWYVVTVGLLIGIIWLLAGTGDDILGLPLKVLQS
ncbi:Zn-dependent protease [Shewanella gelidii]|uniref:Zn-dependent protease n=2 Tax=Shewanella gelidii TaxID=1642821 RepID=A0A917JQB7_9GAMM|nr:site-2 protease family protein [Shewanella gelidii]GGI78320.1 Zn-dependent protease [Shewanella gelidii]